MGEAAPAAGSSSASVSLNTPEYIKAEKTALALVARAEQCTYGLKCKLEKKKIQSDIIQAVLDHLAELNLVNDLRYAQLWLKMKIARGNKGPHMLSLLLKAKGIDSETSEAALSAVLTPEVETMLLKSCLYKTKKSLDTKSAIRYFLKAEGFSADAIERYFEDVDNQ